MPLMCPRRSDNKSKKTLTFFSSQPIVVSTTPKSRYGRGLKESSGHWSVYELAQFRTSKNWMMLWLTLLNAYQMLLRNEYWELIEHTYLRPYSARKRNHDSYNRYGSKSAKSSNFGSNSSSKSSKSSKQRIQDAKTQLQVTSDNYD